MANKFKGDVPFGDAHTMRLGTFALALIQEKFGIPLEEVGARLQAGITDLRTIGFILWAALQQHHPDMTERDVFDLIDEIGIDQVGPLMGAAFEAAAPSAGGNVPAPPKQAGANQPLA